MSSKRVFVTGAAGFIGFHLARALKRRGDEVLGFDNFNDYYSPDLKRKRTGILEKEGIKVVEGDICDAEALSRACQDSTHFVHLAAQAGVRYSLTNPQAYVKANIEGFVNVLEWCRKQKQVSLVYASSSSVYGRNSKTPFSINDPVDHPASLYGATKRSNELLADTYQALYRFSTIGLRFFTVYGPWGRPDMAYFSFTKALMSGEPIEVYNEGKMERDFTYVDDIVEGILAAIDRKTSKSELYNLGNEKPVSVLKFIEILEKITGRKAKKKLLPMQLGDVLSTHADISLSKQYLGFSPKFSLEEGLGKFVEWYSNTFQISA